MKKYISSSLHADTSPYGNSYKVISWDDTYEEDVHYFRTYVEALQYGNMRYNGRCDIEAI